MSKYGLVSIDTIMSKLYREVKQVAEIDEHDVIEYIGEALDAIGAYGQYIDDVCFINVKNHKGDLPTGLVEIIQVAMSMDNVDINECMSDTCTRTCGHEDLDDCNSACDEYVDDDIIDNCWSQHNKYYIPEQRYLDVLTEHNLASRFSRRFFNSFVPLRLSTNSFKNALLSNNNPNMLGVDNSFEYSINNNQIITTAQECIIALAYTRVPLDDKGFPMIPDLQEYKEAITKYIVYKSAFMRFYNNEPNFRGIYEKLEQDWHWYCRQAKNKMMLPNTLDEKENIKDINHRMLKITKGYYGFFGNINTPELFTTNGRRNRIR